MISASSRPPLPDGPWLVVGLARSGLAAARALTGLGHEVICVDSGDPAGAAVLRAEGLEVLTGVDGLAALDRARAVVKSPGVPREAAVVAAARARGLPVLGELELGWRLLDAPFVAVTGTNGKTTTVGLLGEMWRAAGLPVAVAGNVGTAVASLAGTLEPGATVICEASSFQLEDAVAFAPQIAVLLNLAPDHLDRHGTLADYRGAKLRVFAQQSRDDIAVGPADLLADAGGKAVRVTLGSDAAAALADHDGGLWWRGEHLIEHAEIRLPGAHNRQNAMAAAAAALSAGVPVTAVTAALRSFAGVEHRLETVAELGGVRWVNDSKATNVASTLVALASFDAPVHVVLGGQAKGQDLTVLRGSMTRVRRAWLIGEAAGELGAVLEGAVAIEQAGTLAGAVAGIKGAAQPGDIALLSPACASFDQFADFEARGAAFKALVRAGSADARPGARP